MELWLYLYCQLLKYQFMIYFDEAQEQIPKKQLPISFIQIKKKPSLIFFQNDQQQQKIQLHLTNPNLLHTPQKNSSSNLSKDSQNPIIQSQININYSHSIIHINAESQLKHQQQQSDQKYLKSQPSEQKQLSLGFLFSQKILKIQNFDDIKKFIYTPVPQQIQFIFNLIKINNIYSMYLKSTQNKFLMKSFKQSSINQTKYLISIHQNQQLQIIKNMPYYAGHMISDFQRKKYNIFDDAKSKLSVHDPQKLRRFGTVLIQNQIFSRQKKSKLIVPRVVKNRTMYIQANELISGLDQLRKNSHFRQNIQVYKKMYPKQQQQSLINQKLGICKSSKNIMLRKQGTEQIRLILGKTKTDNYKILIKEGLSPFQVFCFAISHIQ